MSRFNQAGTRTAVIVSPLGTEAVPSGRTLRGRAGLSRATRRPSCSCSRSPTWATTRSTSPAAGARRTGSPRWSASVAVEDPEWMARFLPWLRGSREHAHRVRGRARPSAREGARSTAGTARLAGRSSRPRCSAPTSPANCSPTGLRGTAGAVPKPVKRGIADARRRGSTTECAAAQVRHRLARATASATSSSSSHPGRRPQAVAGRRCSSTPSTGATAAATTPGVPELREGPRPRQWLRLTRAAGATRRAARTPPRLKPRRDDVGGAGCRLAGADGRQARPGRR